MSQRPAAAPATWTDARIELLKQLWDKGASCSQIATALGGLSRNAVIGKVHRLALPRPERKRARAPRPPRPPRPPRGGAQVESTRLAPFSARGSGKSKLRAQARAVAAPPRRRPSRPRLASPVALDQFNAAIPFEQRRTLLQLTRASCRWPVGEPGRPDFFFCGARVEAGHPYCAGHRGFAYRQEEAHGRNPPSRRRDRPRDHRALKRIEQ
jgi:GcrA cell cycle regulator